MNKANTLACSYLAIFSIIYTNQLQTTHYAPTIRLLYRRQHGAENILNCCWSFWQV